MNLNGSKPEKPIKNGETPVIISLDMQNPNCYGFLK
jgi:hypothetical protein